MIKVENLWKSFPVTRETMGFKEYLVNFVKSSSKDKKIFWALKDISFEVKDGECFGVIGRNGAGKSTLLSVLLDAIKPTKGNVKVNGERTPLLELGAGFHPDLTGIENVYLNGVLLGNTEEEMHEKLDKILEFSELKEFVHMPVRTYSSGMYVRLAFSVAIHTDPEIMLIDEILAVGDESFQKKSGKALQDLIDTGVTTVFISHSMEKVRNICTRVMWLDHGEIKEIGETETVIEHYLAAS
jgi:ABC-type polysaccharide/polyol phosphate transport system ATPase subunit